MPTINQLVERAQADQEKDQHPGPERGAAKKGCLYPCVYLDTKKAKLCVAQSCPCAVDHRN
jgi:hypothetical protein